MTGASRAAEARLTPPSRGGASVGRTCAAPALHALLADQEAWGRRETAGREGATLLATSAYPRANRRSASLGSPTPGERVTRPPNQSSARRPVGRASRLARPPAAVRGSHAVRTLCAAPVPFCALGCPTEVRLTRAPARSAARCGAVRHALRVRAWRLRLAIGPWRAAWEQAWGERALSSALLAAGSRASRAAV